MAEARGAKQISSMTFPEIHRGTCRSVAGPGRCPGRHEQDLIVAAGPPGAPGVVLIPAIGQRIQDVGVSDDHELSRLPAEPLSKRLTGSLAQWPCGDSVLWLRVGPGISWTAQGIPYLLTESSGSGAGPSMCPPSREDCQGRTRSREDKGGDKGGDTISQIPPNTRTAPIRRVR